MKNEKIRKHLEVRPSPYPFETIRRCYVTQFGGVSADLQVCQVGINSIALEENTKLVEADRVIVGILGKGRARPYFMDKVYEITPLDYKTPDAFQKSFLGEAVFSKKLDMDCKPFDSLRKGQLVVLSGVLSNHGKRGKEWRLDLLAKALREMRVLKF